MALVNTHTCHCSQAYSYLPAAHTLRKTLLNHDLRSQRLVRANPPIFGFGNDQLQVYGISGQNRNQGFDHHLVNVIYHNGEYHASKLFMAWKPMDLYFRELPNDQGLEIQMNHMMAPNYISDATNLRVKDESIDGNFDKVEASPTRQPSLRLIASHYKPQMALSQGKSTTSLKLKTPNFNHFRVDIEALVHALTGWKPTFFAVAEDMTKPRFLRRDPKPTCTSVMFWRRSSPHKMAKVVVRFDTDKTDKWLASSCKCDHACFAAYESLR